MNMSDNNRLHVSIKTTNILVLSYYELIVLFIFYSLFAEALDTKLVCNLNGLGQRAQEFVSSCLFSFS